MSLDNSITVGNVRKIISDSLGLSQLNESYVASPKQYEIPTESIPADIKKIHNDLYKEYIKSLNSTSAKLDTAARKEADRNSSEFRSLKIDEIYNMNSVYLHEMYFNNIGDVNSEIMQDNLSYMRLARDFGTFDDWQRDFLACASSAREGWAACGYSTFLRRFINVTIDLHNVNIPLGFYPVIVIDCWNHAKPANMNSRDYIVAMMRELNWEVIDNRVKRADRIAEALK